MSEIKLAGIIEESITDGPGLRYTLFTQGCSHGCPGCHNPHTHNPGEGFWGDSDEILSKIQANPLLSGVTLSGGEPFEQPEALLPLARGIKALGLELAAYTGYTFEALAAQAGPRRELLALCDVLVDGPFLLEQRNLGLRFRGSENQRILDVPQSLKSGRAVELHDGRWTS